MKMASLLSLLVLLACQSLGPAAAADSQEKAKVLPITKVLQMMEGMVAKGIKEKQEEKVKFTAFWQWCGDQTRIKNDEIAAAAAKIEKLTAEIEKMAALIKKLTARILELQEDVGRWKKDKKAATDVRNKEAADYRATAIDFSESLEALNGAIDVLKKQDKNTAQDYDYRGEEALLQVAWLRSIPIASKKALMAFLQQGQPDVAAMPAAELGVSAPEAYAYEFQSGGVIEMLEKLKDEFQKKRYDLDKEELTAKSAYEQIVQLLTDEIENAEHEIHKKTVLRSETEEAKADAEGERAMTEAEKAEDEKYLSEMTALCEVKKTDFESRQKLRAGELEALKKAIEIMAGAAKDAGDKYLPTLLQTGSLHSTALAQLRKGQSQSPVQRKLAEFLEASAHRFNSKVLEKASRRVMAGPFDKVKKMIKDLIVTLMEEATAEMEHKGWCDAEVGTNKQTRDYKTEAVNKLTNEVEELTALIARLTQEIEDLMAAIAELAEAMADATKTRAENKATNEQTIADAKAAQVATEQAMSILKDFYAKSAEATAFDQQAKNSGAVEDMAKRLTQTPGEDAPETFTKAYKGMMPEGGSVIDFLEVILSDFVRLESDTASQEESEVEEYKKFMFESEKDTAMKKNDVKHKTKKKTDSETKLANTQEELKLTQEQLDDAIAYYEKLKPTCVDSGITYEDRVKQREEEIQSLQEALKILTSQDIDLE